VSRHNCLHPFRLEAFLPVGAVSVTDMPRPTSPLESLAGCRDKLKRACAPATFLIAASVMLSWVAFYNQAPLVFSDTLTYAMSAYQREMPGVFSVFYSAYILPLHQGVTFWPVVFAQGALLAHVLFVTARCVSGGNIAVTRLALIVAILCVFSSVAWLTGEVLPDVFTSILLRRMPNLSDIILGICTEQK
jgi:hypothetical protein